MQNAAQAMAQLSEVEKQRDQLEQKTIAQQAKIENTTQVYWYETSFLICVCIANI